MRGAPRPMRHGLTCVSIVLVGAACQAEGTDEADGTPIEEPTPVTEPNPESTPPSASTTGAPNDDTTTTAPAGTDASDTTTSTLVFATMPPQKTTPATKNVPPGEPATETVYDVGMIDKGLAPFVQIATDDLAERLDVAPASIAVLTAVLVSWPDSALGCPEPDRAYATLITDGSVIELGVGGLVYRYHSGGNRAPFPCDRPLNPVPTPFASQ